MKDLLKKENLVPQLEESTKNVFATMLGLALISEEALIRSSPTVFETGLLATVGIAGPVSGTGYICLSKPFACRIASQFLMCEYAAVDNDVLDAIGELANMVVGGLKTSLEDQLGPMGLSIPTVILSESYVARSSRSGQSVELSFRCEEAPGEKFIVSICLASEPDRSTQARDLASVEA